MASPITNADQESVVEFTEDQKYIFDTKGWIAIPGVLNEHDISEMRDFCYQLREKEGAIPEYHRSSIGGPLEKLTDHPLVRTCTRELAIQLTLSCKDLWSGPFDPGDPCFGLLG